MRRSVEDLDLSLSTRKLSEVSYLTECSTEQFIIHLCGTKICKPISGLRLMTLILLLRKLSGCGCYHEFIWGLDSWWIPGMPSVLGPISWVSWPWSWNLAAVQVWSWVAEATNEEGLTRGLIWHLVFLNLGFFICCCRAVANLCPTLWSRGLQHARLPCPLLPPGVCSNSCHWVSDAIQSSLHL